MKQVHLYLENAVFLYTIRRMSAGVFQFEPDVLHPEAPYFTVVSLLGRMIVTSPIPDSLRWQALEEVKDFLQANATPQLTCP